MKAVKENYLFAFRPVTIRKDHTVGSIAVFHESPRLKNQQRFRRLLLPI